jgi:hypothetical protein
MYGREPTFAGEVDHGALVAELEAAAYGGGALSTGAYALRDVLPLCPPHARVCSWVKPHGAHPRTNGLHNVWEPLIVVGGRQVPPGKRDALVALPARGGGSLPGRKPLAFCAWLFECLGMQPGDELVDLFPGTGIVGRAWGELSAVASSRSDGSVARSSGDASLLQRRDGSPTTSGDAYPSPRARGDASPAAARDASPSPAGDTSSYSCHAPRRCR